MEMLTSSQIINQEQLKQRILIVDDEKIIADTLALILNTIGCESKAVYSGESALAAAEQFQPDILISDVIMAEMSGIEVANIISEKQPNCKVILFSGQAATADLVAHAVSRGHAFEILAKPVHPRTLIELVRGLAAPTNAAVGQ